MLKTRSVQLLLACILLSGCSDPDFFQKDALVKEKHPDGITHEESVWVIAGRHYNRSGFHRFFWGDHHRAIWNTPVKANVFRLHQTKGGFIIDELGGGFQTTSFELEDSTGKKYAFRSLDKDPVHVLYDFWKPTFVTNILRDQTSASNPYAALVVSHLAKAAGVYHTNPELYYVPANDTSFGEHAALVQGKLFLLEEKFKTPADLSRAFENTTDFINSEDALRNRFSSNYHHFDQKAFARARLLDLFLGDWDRHKGQWTWAVTNQGQEVIYKPIPKDRDQVFIKMDDGLIPYMASSRFMARKFQTFNENISDVKALMINAEFIDARLLNELTKDDFRTIARELQQALSDKEIIQAVKALPEPVYAEVGAKLVQDLQKRRAQLPDAATKMYEVLAKDVIVVGSDKVELFTITRLNDNLVKVEIHRPASLSGKPTLLYSRTFHRAETEQLTLHGLDGNDEFILTGEVDNSILVKIYGGLGEDKITDLSAVLGWKNYTHVYDTARGNELELGTEAKDKTTKDVRVHAYDREGN